MQTNPKKLFRPCSGAKILTAMRNMHAIDTSTRIVNCMPFSTNTGSFVLAGGQTVLARCFGPPSRARLSVVGHERISHHRNTQFLNEVISIVACNISVAGAVAPTHGNAELHLQRQNVAMLLQIKSVCAWVMLLMRNQTFLFRRHLASQHSGASMRCIGSTLQY